jgi:hypothetical protein
MSASVIDTGRIDSETGNHMRPATAAHRRIGVTCVAKNGFTGLFLKRQRFEAL